MFQDDLAAFKVKQEAKRKLPPDPADGPTDDILFYKDEWVITYVVEDFGFATQPTLAISRLDRGDFPTIPRGGHYDPSLNDLMHVVANVFKPPTSTLHRTYPKRGFTYHLIFESNLKS